MFPSHLKLKWIRLTDVPVSLEWYCHTDNRNIDQNLQVDLKRGTTKSGTILCQESMLTMTRTKTILNGSNKLPTLCNGLRSLIDG